MSKIFIDPGHGGHDPGAVGSKSREKDNVLKVAKRLKSLLESYGHTVKMSRSTDKFLSLTQRTNMANSWGADYFISLHNNAAVNKLARGFETFIFNGNVSNKTRQFQNAVHDAIAGKIGIANRGKKRANFAVVRQSRMPAVLIEYAFISNNEDEKLLIEKVNQLAEWTCDGIINAVGGSIKGKPSKPAKKPTPKPASKPKSSAYKGTSLVDYLKSTGTNSGFVNRKKLATQNGIKNYRGTAAQNTALLKKLRSGKTPIKTNKKGDQKTNSVVDYLKSIKVDGGFNNRKKLAAQNGIKNYKGTASQNTALLNKLRK